MEQTQQQPNEPAPHAEAAPPPSERANGLVRLEDVHQDVKDSWNGAVTWLNAIFRSYGSPEKLFAKGVITVADRKELLLLLASLEALVRRLLLVIAFTDFDSAKHGLFGRHVRKHRGMKLFPEAFGKKRRGPSLSKFPDSLKEAANEHAKPDGVRYRSTAPERMVSALSCAARLEGVLRVLQNPEPYALRLRARFCDPNLSRVDGQYLFLRVLCRPRKLAFDFEQELDFIEPYARPARERFFSSD